MLSRLFSSSISVARLAKIASNSSYHAVPTMICTQRRNYAIDSMKSNSLQFALNDFRRRMENKSRLSNADLDSLLKKIVKQKVSSVQALEILRFCSYVRANENQLDIVNKIWTELKQQNNVYTVHHYNILLQIAKDKRDAERAQAIFDELVKSDIKPDVLSYQHLLSAYCVCGNMEKAIEILGLMDQENCFINEASFNSLVQCHIICGNIQSAYDTISQLKESGYKLRYNALESLLHHYSKCGDIENVQKTINMFAEEQLELLNRDIFRVMCILAINGHTEHIDSLLPNIKQTVELRRSIFNAITLFVENRLSSLVPKFIQSANCHAIEKYKALIQEMVRLETPEAEFLETWEKIEASGYTIESQFDMFKPGLEGPSEEIILKLLAHMKSRSLGVNEHVFQKLIQLSGNKGDAQVLKTIDFMCSEYGIQPQIIFIRDSILPAMNANENAAQVYAKLRTTKLRQRNIATAQINRLLNNNDISAAYGIATKSQSFYAIDMILRPLLKAYAETGDVTNFSAFVRLIHESVLKYNDYYRDKPIPEADIENKQKEYVGELLFSALKSRVGADPMHIVQLLKAFVENGLSISTNYADRIEKYLQTENHAQASNLLKKLSSGELKPKPIKTENRRKLGKQLSSDELKNMLELNTTYGQGTGGSEKELFYSYIKEGNISEIETILKNSKFTLTNSDYAQLIDMYTTIGNLENALGMLKRVSANNASFKLNVIKVAKLVTLMYEKNRDFSEIDAILLAHRKDKAEFRIFIFEHLLDKLADNGKATMVENLYDKLVKYAYIEPTVESLGPLIVAQMQKNNYAEAVAKYEHCGQTYKLLPMTMVLFANLIKNNEIDLLQRAFEQYESVRGESAALGRLAFAFIECGQERQAKSIFENPSLKNISTFIKRECEQYVKFGKLANMKTLLTATKGLYCDRSIIYDSILDIYIKRNMAEESLKLWGEYSTDEILPPPAFKNKLATLLTKNNVELPFDLESEGTSTPTINQKKAAN